MWLSVSFLTEHLCGEISFRSGLAGSSRSVATELHPCGVAHHGRKIVQPYQRAAHCSTQPNVSLLIHLWYIRYISTQTSNNRSTDSTYWVSVHLARIILWVFSLLPPFACITHTHTHCILYLFSQCISAKIIFPVLVICIVFTLKNKLLKC